MNYKSLDSLMIIYNEDLSDLEVIIESAVDTLKSSLFDMANEAEGNHSSSASEISSKYRSGFNKIKKSRRSKNNSLVSQGQKEINEASRELQEAERNAKTPEEKKKLSTVAKIAIGVGTAALVGLLAYVGVKNRGKITNSLSRLKKNSGTSVNGAVQDVNNAVQTIVNTPVQDTPSESRGENKDPKCYHATAR